VRGPWVPGRWGGRGVVAPAWGGASLPGGRGWGGGAGGGGGVGVPVPGWRVAHAGGLLNRFPHLRDERESNPRLRPLPAGIRASMQPLHYISTRCDQQRAMHEGATLVQRSRRESNPRRLIDNQVS